ncbi:MAG: carboxypeptidase regulatory-like domain-containing protein [Deltaproteobacteria bacterium]|nr:carboxypeptidase regulatory-like domain-containing protein [Deltaproteobacteria bacterium]
MKPGALLPLPLAVLLLLPACDIPLQDRAAGLLNACEQSEQCGADGICREGSCVSIKADLAGLIIQVDLPVSAPFGPETSHVVELAARGRSLQGIRPEGYLDPFDLELAPLVTVAGRLSVSPAPDGCTPGKGNTLPTAVQMIPAEATLGLALTVYSFSPGTATGAGNDYAFSLDVPAGNYHIYLVPAPPPTAEEPGAEEPAKCVLPPVLLSDRSLFASQSVNVDVGAPRKLTGTIQAEARNMADWTLDLVDNRSGLVISTATTFNADQGNDEIVCFLDDPEDPGRCGRPLYVWPEFLGEALLRLRPPEAAEAMPTVLWSLAALDLDGDFDVSLDIALLGEAKPLDIEGKVLDEGSGGGAVATVSVQSQQLLGGKFGANAAYKTSVGTDPAGGFRVPLLPGTYKVTAVPSAGSHLALTGQSWIVTAGDLGGGHTIALDPKPHLVGSASTPRAEPAAGVSIYLQPSASAPQSYLEQVLTTTTVLPSSATMLTDAAGAFSLEVDPGVLDLAAQPSPSSGYPWLVLSRVAVKASADPATTDLGSLALSNPVVLRGTLLSPEGLGLGGALVRAWLPVQSQNEGGEPTAIQVGETLSDAAGGYILRLPASLCSALVGQ